MGATSTSPAQVQDEAFFTFDQWPQDLSKQLEKYTTGSSWDGDRWFKLPSGTTGDYSEKGKIVVIENTAPRPWLLKAIDKVKGWLGL